MQCSNGVHVMIGRIRTALVGPAPQAVEGTARWNSQMQMHATVCVCRFVGEVTRVNPTLIRSLVDSGYIPVVATVATDGKGQALNVNADTAAGEVRKDKASRSGGGGI